MTATNVTELIEARLRPLEPERVELYDDSGAHVGHAGARGGGGHYELVVVSRHFAGASPVQRHRMVYDAVSDLMRRDIHALSIRAYAPGEL